MSISFVTVLLTITLYDLSKNIYGLLPKHYQVFKCDIVVVFR